MKQYAPRLLDKVTHKAAGINDIILGRDMVICENPKHKQRQG